MASGEERDLALVNLVRDCVRDEIEIQRSGSQGNTNLLLRTRQLIRNASRSASREVGNAPPFTQPCLYSSTRTGTSSATTPRPGFLFSSGQSSQTSAGSKRSSQHPWRFSNSNRKGKLKKTSPEFHPKSIHLLDIPEADHEELGKYIPDYSIKDDMILLKGFFELGTGQTEAEIRESITEVIKQRFPFVRSTYFDFVKRDRNMITTPVVNNSLQWDYKHIKELCGQGKLYVRLNIPRECIESTIHDETSEGDEERDEDLMKNTFSTSNNTATPAASKCSTAAVSVPCTSVLSEQDVVEIVHEETSSSTLSTPPDSTRSRACASSSFVGQRPSRQSVRDKLRELLPSTSDEDIDEALQEHHNIESAANALLLYSPVTVVDENQKEKKEVLLVEILCELGNNKLTGKRQKLEIDQEDLVNDAIAFYKSVQFSACCPIRVSFTGQPAIDSGGVLRQFYSDLFEKLAEGELMELFEGENNRKVPSYRPHAVMSGMLEMVGKIIAHSLVQGGPGFPCLALPCYYYLVTGDVTCAMAYCNCWDIPDSSARNIVIQIMDAKTDEEMENLSKDDEVLNLLSQCGETSVLSLSTQTKVIQGVAMYEVLLKRKTALDQFRKGLKILGVLNEMQNHPHLFESVFTFMSVELTSATVKECFEFPDDMSDQEQNVKSMLTRFVDQSPQKNLMQLMQFCTGTKGFPSVRNFKVKVNFHSDSYMFASTCTFVLQIPNCFQSYGLFKIAIESAISTAGKSFTTVRILKVS